MKGSTLLILGGRSDIGRAIARRFAAQGASVILAARNAATLADDASDLANRYGVAANALEFDVTDGHPAAFFDALGALPDCVVMVAGLLGDNARSEAESVEALRVMATNYTGPAVYLLEAARRMSGRGSGSIVGISSVAGDRGRQSNYIYGSAKAGLSAFLDGLRNRLHPVGVHVVTVKPGFVDTQMTQGMKLPGPLTASPNEVAAAILVAVRRKKNTVYVKPIWRVIMMIICLIPEPVFKKMRL
jgi:hypothetical protein